MNAARPISSEEFKSFRSELYQLRKDSSREDMSYQVKLDEDPSRVPLNISMNLSKVQGFLERTAVILNRAILATAYWKAIVDKVELKWDAEFNRSMVDPVTAKAASNAEGRKAFASVQASEAVVKLYRWETKDEKGTVLPARYEDQLSQVKSNYVDSMAFKDEIENIWKVLETAGTALAVQQKNSVYSRSLQGSGREEVNA
jgi:hypothetical protein